MTCVQVVPHLGKDAIQMSSSLGWKSANSRSWTWSREKIIVRKMIFFVKHKQGSIERCVFLLKELYTSETTLAQTIVLTPLNNEFKLKIWNSTSFMLKNPPIFLEKIYKNQFLASWRGLMVFIHLYKVVYF